MSASPVQQATCSDPDALAAALASRLHRLARPHARAAEAFVQARGWFSLGYARAEDFARERLGRTGRWLRDYAALGRAARRSDRLLRALDGADGGPPLGTVAAVAIARNTDSEHQPTWIALARAAGVRELKQRLRQARAAGCSHPVDADGRRDDSHRPPDDLIEWIASACPEALAGPAFVEAAAQPWNRRYLLALGLPVPPPAPPEGPGEIHDPELRALAAWAREEYAGPGTEDGPDSDSHEPRARIRLDLPAALVAAFHEVRQLHRCVCGAQGTLTGFAEALVAEARASGLDPHPDLDGALELLRRTDPPDESEREAVWDRRRREWVTPPGPAALAVAPQPEVPEVSPQPRPSECSPLAPASECSPLAPPSECSPLAPPSEWSPLAPASGCFPLAPPSEWSPLAPASGCSPLAPASECSPLAPASECSPLAPTSGRSPLAPPLSSRADRSPCPDPGPESAPEIRRAEDLLGRAERLFARAGQGDAAELAAQLHELVGIEEELRRALGELLAVMARSRAWAALGFNSIRHYAEVRLGMSRSVAEDLATLARALDRLPVVEEAHAAGRLSCLAALRVVRILGRHPATADLQHEWVARAESATIKRLDDERHALRARRLLATPPERRSAFPLSDADWHRSLGRSPGETTERIGAFARLADERRGDIATLRLVLPFGVAADFLGALEAAARRVRTFSAGLAPFDARWLGLYALLTSYAAAHDTHRGPRGVYARDGWRCMAPGCTSSSRLEDHHVLYRARGGDDGQDNRVTLCRFHHQRGEHGGAMRVRGRAPLGLEFELGGILYRNERALVRLERCEAIRAQTLC